MNAKLIKIHNTQKMQRKRMRQQIPPMEPPSMAPRLEDAGDVEHDVKSSEIIPLQASQE